ncbi:hypothetical protein XaC1_95 [Xanthomonas phage XaC1]|nr:hypothetical protein XaC1_95 [Xanthomonas phage XaC1]
MKKEKFFKLIEVLKTFNEHAPDIPHNVVHKMSHWYYKKTGYIFTLYNERSCTKAVAGVSYERKNNNNIIFNSEYALKFHEEYVVLSTVEDVTIYDKNIKVSKADYFNLTLLHNIPFSYEDIENIFEVLKSTGPEFFISLEKL